MQVFQQDLIRKPVEMSLQRNDLYEEILRRFIDGIMKFGDRRQGAWVLALRYDDRRIDRRCFRTHEDIGADRTEKLMTLLSGGT